MVALARNPKRTPVCTSIDNSPVPHVPCATFVACYICSVVASPIRSIDENDALVCYANNTLVRQALSGPLLACVRMIARAVAMPDPMPERHSGTRRSVRRAAIRARAARLHGASLDDGRAAGRPDREHGRDAR